MSKISFYCPSCTSHFVGAVNWKHCPYCGRIPTLTGPRPQPECANIDVSQLDPPDLTSIPMEEFKEAKPRLEVVEVDYAKGVWKSGPHAILIHTDGQNAAYFIRDEMFENIPRKLAEAVRELVGERDALERKSEYWHSHWEGKHNQNNELCNTMGDLRQELKGVMDERDRLKKELNLYSCSNENNVRYYPSVVSNRENEIERLKTKAENQRKELARLNRVLLGTRGDLNRAIAELETHKEKVLKARGRAGTWFDAYEERGKKIEQLKRDHIAAHVSLVEELDHLKAENKRLSAFTKKAEAYDRVQNQYLEWRGFATDLEEERGRLRVENERLKEQNAAYLAIANAMREEDTESSPADIWWTSEGKIRLWPEEEDEKAYRYSLGKFGDGMKPEQTMQMMWQAAESWQRFKTERGLK